MQYTMFELQSLISTIEQLFFFKMTMSLEPISKDYFRVLWVQSRKKIKQLNKCIK